MHNQPEALKQAENSNQQIGLAAAKTAGQQNVQGKPKSRKTVTALVAAILVVLLVNTGLFFLVGIQNAAEKYVTKAPPKPVQVIDLNAAGKDPQLKPMSSYGRTASKDGTPIVRLKVTPQPSLFKEKPNYDFGEKAAIINELTAKDSGERIYIPAHKERKQVIIKLPENAGDCDLINDAIVCEIGGGKAVAYRADSGETIKDGDYTLGDKKIDEAISRAKNVAHENGVSLPAEIDRGAKMLAALKTRDGVLAADSKKIVYESKNGNGWVADISETDAKLNGFDSENPRWLATDKMLIYATGAGMVARSLGSGSELWKIAAAVKSWFISGDRLYVLDNKGMAVVYDLTAEKTDADSVEQLAQQAKEANKDSEVLNKLAGLKFGCTPGTHGVTISVFSANGEYVALYSSMPYASVSKGRLEITEKIDDFSYRIKLVDTELLSPRGGIARAQDGQRTEWVGRRHCWDTQEDPVLFLPGKPVDKFTAAEVTHLNTVFGSQFLDGKLKNAMIKSNKSFWHVEDKK
ncbi:MAG: hypothetical protein Q4C71_02060 [Microbacteriaceae bacterium]|nr:hypothetical protein [Microbacteriaceae bacterium]